MTGSRQFRFDGHRFDAETGELHGPAGPTRLQPQPAKVLELLLSRPGELVTRDALKQAVWPDTVVEADQGLNYCIRQIRAALGDESEANRLLETLPRRGYRFRGTIEGASPPASLPRRTSRRVWVGVALAIGLGAVAAWLAFRPPRVVIGVLPFETAGAEGSVAIANRELTERLVVRLAATEGFAVVGPATTEALAGDPRPHTELGRALGVDYLISGGIRLEDSTLFVQAVRASDGVHAFAWRRSVVGQAPDELVAQIVAAARPRLNPGAATR